MKKIPKIMISSNDPMYLEMLFELKLHEVGRLKNRPIGFDYVYFEKNVFEKKTPLKTHIQVLINPNKEVIRPIYDAIEKRKHSLFKHNDYHFFVYALKDKESNLQGGLYGYIGWNYAYIDTLIICDTYKNKGYGKKLIKTLENDLSLLNINHVFLGTTSFQAESFYLKQGYEIFGIKKNFPKPYDTLMMKKTLKTS